MKILFTGGGTGGHFYPIIAVAKEVRNIAKKRKLLDPELYYIAPNPYDNRVLFENDIIFKKSPAGKMRRYFSFWNIIDVFKTAIGIVKTMWQVFTIYPDVIFSKGGYASFPTVVAARIFRIPLVIHESDATAGRANKWAGKFAEKIAIAYTDAADDFPKGKVAHTGNPVRHELFTIAGEGAHEFLKLKKDVPVILILGGSQGSEKINEAILGALPHLLNQYQIIHQTGKKNFKEVEQTARVILEGHAHIGRYKPLDYLSVLALRNAAGAASLVISRAGSGAIFEIALWGLPAILIPIPEDVSRDQERNAFAYARSGSGIVVEEKNLTPNILVSEINRLMDNESLRRKMSEQAKKFATPDAARIIAEALIDTALRHES